MSWKEKTVARILLIVARMLTDDPEIHDELKKLATHISVSVTEPVAVAS